MAPAGRPSSRDRIVAAAVELSKEVGPGHVSLDAVAQRAGVSKGGLLYNFPTKQKLLEAIVAHHIEEFATAFQKEVNNNADKTDGVISACVELFEKKHKNKMPPASGFLAALIENPDLMHPARVFNRRLVDMIRANASNEAAALVVFLAIEGLRCLPLLDLDVLTKEERDLAVQELHNMVSRG